MDFYQIWYVWFCKNLFGIADGQIFSIFDRVICPTQDSGWVLSFQVFIYLFHYLGKFSRWKIEDLFYYFSQKTGFDISCK